MSDASRARILTAVKQGAGHAAPKPSPNIVPTRGQGTPPELVERLAATLTAASVTVLPVAALADIGPAIVDYLVARNLPMRLAAAPDARLDALEGDRRLTVRRGPAGRDDLVGVTMAAAGIAENGCLMLVSGGETPNSLNFLPDISVVVLEAKDVVGSYENAWDAVRARFGTIMPRTVTLVAGPSRTADIEQIILHGAHGPRQLAVVLVGSV